MDQDGVALLDAALGETGGQRADPIVEFDNAATMAVISQSSSHPGGANHTFCDGSVHFIQNSVSSWLPSATNPFVPGWPSGLAWSANIPTNYGTLGIYSTTSPYGVYQSLSTRNGNEIVSSDQY